MGRRNQIRVIGDSPRQGFTILSDELIRAGAHHHALGSDGFVVMAFLLSWAVGPKSRLWETSAADISEQLGWGQNRERARKALESAEKDGRLIRREYVRDGKSVRARYQYVVCAGGRKFADDERVEWSRPVVLESRRGVRGE